MRLGVFSDVHSNYEALKASFAALEQSGVDKFICAGDIVGYGANPKECIEFIREREILCVKGNHDHYTTLLKGPWDIQPYAEEVIRWTQMVLDKEDIDYLTALPYTASCENVLFAHASLEAIDGEYWPYILDPKTALFHFFLQDTRFAFFGHTHIPLFFTYDENHKISIEILKSRKIPDEQDKQYLINPGSVGQPRDFDARSSVVIFDTESYDIELLRVEYDIARTQKSIISAGLPKLLADRLSRGN